MLFTAVSEEISEEYIYTGFEHAIFTVCSSTTKPILKTFYLRNSLYS